jgi:hypothetical protein
MFSLTFFEMFCRLYLRESLSGDNLTKALIIYNVFYVDFPKHKFWQSTSFVLTCCKTVTFKLQLFSYHYTIYRR